MMESVNQMLKSPDRFCSDCRKKTERRMYTVAKQSSIFPLLCSDWSCISHCSLFQLFSGWKSDYGGYTTYLTSGEDEEVKIVVIK